MPKTKKVETEKQPKTSVKTQPTKKEKVAVEEPKKVVKKTGLITDVLDLEGKSVGKITLNPEIFEAKVNKSLIAQAVRVYLANQRQGNASTKTRGEVEGSTRKIYRQKGTGRARHGSIRAPIFVHGGIVGGPKPRDYSLKLPQKMKQKALFAALTAKFKVNEIKILKGLEEIEPKTKKFVTILKKLGLENKKNKILLIALDDAKTLKRAASNIPGVTITAVQRLSTYDVVKNRHLLFMQTALEVMEKHYLKK